MPLSDLIFKAVKALKSNSPEILTALGVTGVVSTAYLAGKASYHAARQLESEDPYASFRDKAKLTWRLYIPTAISGAATIGCIIGASKSTGRRTTAAMTAYSLTERAFSEYREKVIEQIGEVKEQTMRDELVQAKIDGSPPESKEVIILGGGHVLCCELYTSRYFRSDMEMLRRAQNDINAKILRDNYVDLNEFYDIVGLPSTSHSDRMGWNFDRQMELRFSTVLAPDGEPCLAFEYNYVKPL